ncbi:50S ribosomal protein L13 [Candidatus Parvarchaeota archaeon]|nr:50S ribosomal protein L13 [Candidatus Parvarchaeota archaeon]
MKTIDGTNLIMGRLCAQVAKELLKGEKVAITNPDKIVISGSLAYLTEKYSQRRTIKNKANPMHKPKWPRLPNLMLRKVISGMLPKKTSRGKAAMKNLKVYPAGMSLGDAQTVKGIDGSMLERSTTLGQVCRRLGWNA